jgi:phosphoglucomutase
MSELSSQIDRALQSGQLRESSAKNLHLMLAAGGDPCVEASIRELLSSEAWPELNDRFYRTLAFGTGGLRGRTIGRTVTKAEQGAPQELGRPELPCVGTNAMNYFNVSRATQGLVAYIKAWMAATQVQGRPKIVVAHDTRFFSKEFAQLASRVATENGCDVCLFEGPRSTPQLSFSVRHENAQGGVVITASHNPPHDNGFKVYFGDGAQVVDPHASGIIAKVNAIESDVYTPLPEPARGKIILLGAENDRAYQDRLQTLVLDPALVRSASGLRTVFTSIHGTGGTIIKPMFERLGFQYSTVPEQEVPDGRFPTVKSPNPENADALSMAIALANSQSADLVIATDPDCDRMGVAVRNRAGEMELLSGNQIGSLMAYYRIITLLSKGVITPENASRCVLIKTFVTTDLQRAIAEKHGLRCVETLTGFKYIGQKLGKYEAALPAADSVRYRSLSELETRSLRLQHSSYYVCGGEESYGYSAADFVRDKDANGAAVVFAEVAAYAKSRQLTLDELMDEVYANYGYYLEKNGSLTFEGAEGSSQIQRLVQSYASNPPATAAGTAVERIRNFAEQDFIDIEGDAIPKEKMLMVDLADGRRFAIRPSGTEPKIKFYLYGSRLPQASSSLTSEDLAQAKTEVKTALDTLWQWIQSDAEARIR